MVSEDPPTRSTAVYSPLQENAEVKQTPVMKFLFCTHLPSASVHSDASGTTTDENAAKCKSAVRV